jgi:hypothetical protein
MFMLVITGIVKFLYGILWHNLPGWSSGAHALAIPRTSSPAPAKSSTDRKVRRALVLDAIDNGTLTPKKAPPSVTSMVLFEE